MSNYMWALHEGRKNVVHTIPRSGNQLKWDDKYMSLASHVAQWSKDPSTKVGAVVVSERNTVASLGYNGFPRGVDDARNRYDDRERKYELVVHAEANAILSASRDVTNHTLYTTLAPCNECMKLVIQSGIKRVVYGSYRHNEAAETMAREAGIICEPIERLHENHENL